VRTQGQTEDRNAIKPDSYTETSADTFTRRSAPPGGIQPSSGTRDSTAEARAATSTTAGDAAAAATAATTESSGAAATDTGNRETRSAGAQAESFLHVVAGNIHRSGDPFGSEQSV